MGYLLQGVDVKFNKIYIATMLCLLSLSVFCAQSSPTDLNIKKTFNVSTMIDLINLYPFTLDLVVIPNDLELSYNDKLLMFDDEIVELRVQSNIPTTSDTEIPSFNFNLMLFENTSACKDFSGALEGASNFISIFIKGSNIDEYSELDIGKPIENISFNSFGGDEYQTGYLNLKLNQRAPFDSDVYLTRYCSGNVVIGVELSL